MTEPRRRVFARRGSTLLLVLWTIGVTTLMLISLQMSAYRQATSGREVLGRVRAKWAARAGVEMYIAYLAWEAQNAETVDLVQFRNAMEDLAQDDLYNAAYLIEHDEDGEMEPGPADAHAKLNVNLLDQETLMKLENMQESTAASILDWIDSDEEPRPGGLETGYYTQLPSPYETRNGPIRTLAELELVFGVEPEDLREEDWNLNGVLDGNENDGSLTPPDDNADGYLDAGWSAVLTASSLDNTLGPSGEPKVSLRDAEVGEISARLGVDATQAQALKAYAGVETNTLANLMIIQLSTIGQDGNPGTQPLIGARNLNDAQLRAVFAESMIVVPADRVPGKVNLNTAPREVLELLPGITPAAVEAILAFRLSQSTGFSNVLDLLSVPGLTPDIVAQMLPVVDVRSSVYVITSKGRANPGRTEVELVVTLDRSRVPIEIIDYLER